MAQPVKRTYPRLTWAVLALLILFTGFTLLLRSAPITAQDEATGQQPLQTLYRLQTAPWTASNHREAARILSALGDLSAAVAHWEAARALEEAEDPLLLRRLADGYLALQRWPELAATLRTLLNITPDDRWATYQLGLVLAAYDPITAETYLRQAVRYPEYGQFGSLLLNVILVGGEARSLNIGQAFGSVDLWGHAEMAFNHAAIINYPDPVALAYVGLAREQQGKTGTAWIDQALALGPQQPQVHYVHGLYLRRAGDYDGSLAAFQQAAAQNPDNPAYYAEISAAYEALFDYEQAAYWLNIALETSDDDPEFASMLAAFYARNGQNLPPDSLETLYAAGDDLPDDDPALLAEYGWSLHIQGDSESGLEQIETALEINPNEDAALYYKARIIAGMDGRVNEAVTLMQYLYRNSAAYRLDAQRFLQAAGVIP